MARYFYTARDQHGVPTEGVIDAPTVELAQDQLRRRELIVLSLHVEEKREAPEWTRSFTQNVRSKDIVVFSRQLAVLINATVPIVRSLRILAAQTQSKTLQKIVAQIASDVDGGTRLSVAMKQHAHVFDDFFVYMVRAGETTGRLDEVLTYLADEKEKDYKLMSRVISTMIYPAFIVTAMIGIFIFMMAYVVPQMLSFIEQSGQEPPLVTQILITISAIFQGYWWAMLLGIVGIGIATTIANAQPAGKHFLDALKLRVPLLGRIFQRLYLARMSRSLANLLSAGVPLNKSIDIVADVVGNTVYKELLHDARRAVEGGHPLSHALAESSFVPPMMTQMMAIGEETGRLDQILERVSSFYVDEVDSMTQALVSLIEPIIIISLGAGALLLVAGILLPTYTVTGAI